MLMLATPKKSWRSTLANIAVISVYAIAIGLLINLGALLIYILTYIVASFINIEFYDIIVLITVVTVGYLLTNKIWSKTSNSLFSGSLAKCSS